MVGSIGAGKHLPSGDRVGHSLSSPIAAVVVLAEKNSSSHKYARRLILTVAIRGGLNQKGGVGKPGTTARNLVAAASRSEAPASSRSTLDPQCTLLGTSSGVHTAATPTFGLQLFRAPATARRGDIAGDHPGSGVILLPAGHLEIAQARFAARARGVKRRCTRLTPGLQRRPDAICQPPSSSTVGPLLNVLSLNAIFGRRHGAHSRVGRIIFR